MRSAPGPRVRIRGREIEPAGAGAVEQDIIAGSTEQLILTAGASETPQGGLWP
jgi:hypothetical protein